MQFKYDTNVFQNKSIQTIDDLINIIDKNRSVVFMGPFGMGKTMAAIEIEREINNKNMNYHIVNLDNPKVEKIRQVLEEFDHIHLSEKNKLIIINEKDTSSSVAIDELRSHTDGSKELQVKLLLLTNNTDPGTAIGDRTVFVKFNKRKIVDMVEFQKDILAKYIDNDIYISLHSYANELDYKNIECSYRQFYSIINLIINNKYSVQDAFDSVLDSEKINITACKNVNAYLFSVINRRRKLDIKEFIEVLNQLKTHQEILHFFNYGKSILSKNDNNNNSDSKLKIWFLYNRAHVEYLSIRSRIFSENDLKVNKNSILIDALFRAQLLK